MQKEQILWLGGGGNSVTIDCMELTIDILLEKMNEATAHENLAAHFWDASPLNWKIDTNISNIYPVLEWE